MHIEWALNSVLVSSVKGPIEIKVRQTPSGLYSSQAVSDISDWLQVA